MNTCSSLAIIFFLLTPVLAAARLHHRVDSSESAHNELINYPDFGKSEFLGKGKLKGPEDILYDKKSGVIYTGCADGWIKRVTVNKSADDTVVEDWVNTGGRPLGLARVPGTRDIIVADAYKGLLRIKANGTIEVLTDQANGTKFKLTDGVEVAEDGKIYFTDASSKYNLKEFMWDIVEGKPNGRLLCYDPKIRRTKVLADRLYFPNGVSISPTQQFLLFSETPKKRCKKYYIKGKRKGQLTNFIEVPGMPDNIHHDTEGNFWIATTTSVEPLLMKAGGKFWKNGGAAVKEEKGGVFKVNSEGKLLKNYSDTEVKLVSSGIKIGNYLYCGSIVYPFIVRLTI